MSLSNPTPTNPAKHFMQWSGSRGVLEWYNKEKKENIPVKMPFEFIVLDELATITGYSKQDESGFWSNEVRNVSKDQLNVKNKRGTREIGLWRDIKGSSALTGAKYAQSVYVAHKVGSEWVIGNLKLFGAALTAWIELKKMHAVETGKLSLTGMTEGKNGATTYAIPTFEYSKWSQEEYEAAFALDKELQVYLSQYLSAQEEYNPDELPDLDEVGKATPEQIADFEARKKKAGMAAPADDGDPGPESPGLDEIADVDLDEPINLDDIPF